VTKLVQIFISSIYGGLMPACLAKLHPKVKDSFYELVKATKEKGGKVVVSDMFRPWQVQADLRRRKPRLAAAPGNSYHEAGLAFDFDVSQLGIPLATFRSICRRYGWEPIKSECWHIQHPYKTLGYVSL
jgi:hypothetical protein